MKYKLQLLVVGEYTRINLFYHSLNLQKRIHRPVLPGVTIGENSIIGANSVVTKNIPANSIAVGNPARVVKKYNFNTQKWERV